MWKACQLSNVIFSCLSKQMGGLLLKNVKYYFEKLYSIAVLYLLLWMLNSYKFSELKLCYICIWNIP